ncbi:tol-pal system protein YbgF [Oceanidesulfovibrio marinus]|uniref:tol-pal system protein YbgF n=1 Tax=Oceanidesulfovibrio marinus TaxID=370038 RepID=UPI001FD3D763|nr:tol-pal system protein YbgF [Oceanidesulfovibrio marinus]
MANLESRVMDLEEQNRRQASELEARMDRLERYAVAEGVEKDRIRAAIAAARSSAYAAEAQPMLPLHPATETVTETVEQEEIVVESVETEPRLHPVSPATARNTEPAVDSGPGPETPYAEPTPAVYSAPQSNAAATVHKPSDNELPYAYTEAVRLTRSGNTEKGRQMLRAFIMENPDSPLVPNAYYWLGETYYHDKRYAQAILTFKEVTSRFPKDPKAAASLLKIGYSYEMLGDKNNARFYLNALLEDYPKSEPAKLARKALDEGY